MIRFLAIYKSVEIVSFRISLELRNIVTMLFRRLETKDALACVLGVWLV